MNYDLVFEGGGAKGMVFIGACEELFGRGHSFDRLLGTSAGAITATLLAAGYTPQEMLASLVEKGLDGKTVFAGFMGPPAPFSDEELQTSATQRLLDGVDLTFIVLLSAAGNGTMSIMRAVGKSKPSVWRWQERYLAQGIAGLKRDATRPGRKPPLTAEVIARVVQKTLREKPQAATHWSTRTMAQAVGLSHTSVKRIWNAHGLKPHLTRGFKLSNDKRFVEKVQDVVGLYLCPPDKALVLSVDEKSQVQALDRTQPGLPMKKGRAGTMTHDYKRHGTTSLFAALDVATGAVIGQCMKRHRHHEFLRFLRTIHRQTPKKLDLHLILDNYATHKHSNVKTWLAKHPRFHLHFTPTSASWLNQVERFFGLITQERIRRGVFTSVPELEAAIHDYLDHHNADPKPFVWTKSAEEILAKVARARNALEQVAVGNEALNPLH